MRSCERNTRSFASAGFARTSFCNSASAAFSCPARNACSAVLMGCAGVSRCDTRSAAAGRLAEQRSAGGSLLGVAGDVPLHLAASLFAALVVLHEVLDMDFGEVQGDVLGEPIFAAAAARGVRGDQH